MFLKHFFKFVFRWLFFFIIFLMLLLSLNSAFRPNGVQRAHLFTGRSQPSLLTAYRQPFKAIVPFHVQVRIQYHKWLTARKFFLKMNETSKITFWKNEFWFNFWWKEIKIFTVHWNWKKNVSTNETTKTFPIFLFWDFCQFLCSQFFVDRKL